MTWHYQWVVLNDYLKTLVGAPLLADSLGRGRQLYQPESSPLGASAGAGPFIAVEFSVAAYRFGHTMIPQRIQIQAGAPALDVFGPSLGFGFSPLTVLKAVVHWPQVLDLNDTTVDRADCLDAKLAKDLLELPFVEDGDEKSLATRNLLRGQAFRLPSGETLAQACKRPQAEVEQVTQAARALAATVGADLSAGTPTWLYVLLEGAKIGRETTTGVFQQGEGLGPVGGRVVAETLIGLMELDSGAYLGSNRSLVSQRLKRQAWPQRRPHAARTSDVLKAPVYLGTSRESQDQNFNQGRILWASNPSANTLCSPMEVNALFCLAGRC